MKPISMIGTLAAVCGLSLALPLQAQNTAHPSTAPDRDLHVTTHPSQTTLAEPQSGTTEPTPVSKANKASGLIGMDVRNPQNEKLGDIKDLVVDLHSGKIAYAVVSVGGFLGIGDKYVAVPPSAFTTAPDQSSLVLNADKAKLQNAPSFSKSSWPEINSRTWNADTSYWMDNSAQGTAAAIRSGTATASDYNSTRATDHENTALSSKSAQANATKAGDDHTFHGKITAVSPESRTMTVQGESGSRQFKFTETPSITVQGNRTSRISDLKVGYPVVVMFHDDNGTAVADTVKRADAPAEK